jgi:predicted DNA-binding ribbon-helix-helix protein
MPSFSDSTGRGQAVKSAVIKRSIVIAGRKTSVSLEDAFWKGLREIAAARDMTPSELIATINSDRQHVNLSSAIRQFVLGVYRDQISDHRGGTRGQMIA